MNIFSISDLHLSHVKQKSMDIFGPHWRDHWTRIASDWTARVRPEDIVLIAGDISWAMTYEEAEPDLRAIGDMPGRKILIKGNHDYWHCSYKKTLAHLSEGMDFLQNNTIPLDGYAFAGTRGWKQEGQDFTGHDRKIYLRELERLRLSLSAAQKTGLPIYAMIHYPPFSAQKKSTPFTQLFSEFGVRRVVYGHIHGSPANAGSYPDLVLDGVIYTMTACDYLNFKLLQL